LKIDSDLDAATKALLAELKLSIETLTRTVVDLQHGSSFNCCPMHYSAGHRNGPCSEAQLVSHVYHNMDSLNEKFKLRVDEVQQTYQVKFDEFCTRQLAREAELEA
jgi:hypothetical protein